MWKNKLLKLIKNPRTHYAAAAAVGFSAGVPAGYFGFKRFRDNEYETRLEKEIAQTEAFYKSLNVLRKKPDPVDLAKKYERIEAQDYDNLAGTYRGIVPKVLPNDTSSTTYFDEESDAVSRTVAESESDLSPTEMAILDRQKAAEGKPYPITEEAFFSEETGYSQLQYTYWEGDGTVTDGQEQEVFDVEESVGRQNLELFEQLTEDGSTIYIRNDSRNQEFEVTKDPGTYQYEVEEQALMHEDRSDRRRPQRFHRGD